MTDWDKKEVGKYAIIETQFIRKKTVYSDDETQVIGYDGEHSTNLVLFYTEQDMGDYIEDMSVRFGEDPELGTWDFKEVGRIDNIYTQKKTTEERK
jgi:hypothetical protein